MHAGRAGKPATVPVPTVATAPHRYGRKINTPGINSNTFAGYEYTKPSSITMGPLTKTTGKVCGTCAHMCARS